MAVTSSMMMPLGSAAPSFSLRDTDGRIVSLEDFSGAPGLVVAFICNHCPYVKHIRAEFAHFGREFIPRGLPIVAISSNDPEAYPADSPERMAREKEEAGYPFPYLYDETQQVARAYHAACTPDFYLFDGHRKLVYQGQFDGSRPGNGIPVTGEDLRAAAEALLAGRSISADQRPSIGCSIKWREGMAPGA